MSEEIIDAEVVDEGNAIEVVRNEDVVEAVEHGMRNMYLSGPMTGIEKYNHDLFNKVAEEFRTAGFMVCSPSEFFDGDRTKERKEYMREAIKYMLEADTIVLLPGWQESKGARLEAAIATELDLIVVEYVENDNAIEEGSEPATGILTLEDDSSVNLGSFTPIEEK